MISNSEYYEAIRSHNDEAVTQNGEGWASVQLPYRKNQDALFVVEEGEFVVAGVLDGLGAYPESGDVATDVAEYLRVCVEDGTIDAEKMANRPDEYYGFFFDLVEFAEGRNGSTTLALSAIDRTASKVGYVSVGDSRIYLVDSQKHRNQPDVMEALLSKRNDELQHTRLLTEDEEDHGFLTNAISTEVFKGPRQMRSVQATSGDRVVLVTDGVFKDSDSRIGTFSERSIGEFVTPKLSPLDALTNLVIVEAYWPDDRTAIIVDV